MFGPFRGLGLEDSFGIQTTEPQTNSGIPWDSHFPDDPDISQGYGLKQNMFFSQQYMAQCHHFKE